MSDLYLIWKNMTRKPLRLFLTCFSIFIAFLIFSAIATFRGALNSGVELAADDRLVVVNRINFTSPLPQSYVEKVRALEGVKDVTHMNWYGGYYQDAKQQVVIMAVDPASYLRVYPEIVIDPAQRQAWLQDRQGILIGKRLAETYGWKIGDRVPIPSNIFPHKEGDDGWSFVVKGIFTGATEEYDTRGAAIHYEYFRQSASFGGNTHGWLTLTTADPGLNQQVAERIDEMFANSQYETETSTEKAFNQSFIEQVGNIGLIIFGVVFAAFFTILVIVGNTMALAVRERTSEIAVLKTLGFQSGRIFRMVLAESLLIALLGGLLGLGAGWLLVEGLQQTLGQFLPNLSLDGQIAGEAVLYMVGLGLVTGLLPAFSALRLNIVTAFNRG